MSRKFSEEQKVERSILRDWRDMMLPFIEKHKSSDIRANGGYFGGLNYGSGKVRFENSENFEIEANYGFGDYKGNFVYGRKIDPFKGEVCYRDNNFGGDIVRKLKNCFDAEGFDIAFGNQPFGTGLGLPGLAF